MLRAATSSAPAVAIRYGVFLNTLIDFIIIAFAIFMMVKGMNSMEKKPEASKTKECPHCMSTINVKATRCPNCTSELKK